MAQIFASERSRPRQNAARSPARSAADPALRALQDKADRSPASRQLAQLQARAGEGTAQRIEDEEPLQGKAGPGGLGAEPVQRAGEPEEEELQMKARPGGQGTEPVQRAAPEEEEPLQGKAAGPQGLPTALRQGMESLSGVDSSAVRVHYNSDRPAQMNAHAYAQGSDIHIAPGQERHLPHEAWHTVQQAQGRVAATTDVDGQPVNDDVGLEREADVMGARAMQQAKR